MNYKLEQKTPSAKTWTKFKLHFCHAHQQCKETSKLQAQNSSYHANTIRDIIDKLWAETNTSQETNTALDQDNISPPASSSDVSTDLSISALQPEVV